MRSTMAYRSINIAILLCAVFIFGYTYYINSISVTDQGRKKGTDADTAPDHKAETVLTTNTNKITNAKPDEFWKKGERIPEFCWDLDPVAINNLPTLYSSARSKALNSLRKKGPVKQDDPSILDYMYDNCDVLLRPPDGKPTNYKGPNPSMGQAEVVFRILNNMTEGFFIECGGFDGVTSSNTLQFERNHGWQGLIIEPDPTNLRNLYSHHRNAWMSHSCLSIKEYPHEVITIDVSVFFKPSLDLGRISQVVDDSAAVKEMNKAEIRVQCFPFFSFIAALDIKVVDFLSLDVEGDELKILKTIPFDRVFIKVIAVEIVTSEEGQEPYKKFMESKGYRTVGVFYHGERPFDLLFVHSSISFDESVVELLNKPKVG